LDWIYLEPFEVEAQKTGISTPMAGIDRGITAALTASHRQVELK
jgi:hypothetical protein